VTTVQLIKACKAAIDNPHAYGKISLLVPGRYAKKKLFPGTRVYGETVCEYENDCLVAFDAKMLLGTIVHALPDMWLDEEELTKRNPYGGLVKEPKQ